VCGPDSPTLAGERGCEDLDDWPFGTRWRRKRDSDPRGGRRFRGRSRLEYHLHEGPAHPPDTSVKFFELIGRCITHILVDDVRKFRYDDTRARAKFEDRQGWRVHRI